jgi:hypothetical protein
MSGGLQPMLQATVGNGLSFNRLSFGQDNRARSGKFGSPPNNRASFVHMASSASAAPG